MSALDDFVSEHSLTCPCYSGKTEILCECGAVYAKAELESLRADLWAANESLGHLNDQRLEVEAENAKLRKLLFETRQKAQKVVNWFYENPPPNSTLGTDHIMARLSAIINKPLTALKEGE